MSANPKVIHWEKQSSFIVEELRPTKTKQKQEEL